MFIGWIAKQQHALSPVWKSSPLCQTHCCLTVTEDSTPMLGRTITLPFVQAAQKRRCQRARLMLLGNTTCCALVYSSSSSILCVYTSPFSRDGGVGGVEVVAVLIQSGLAKTAFLWQLCWYCVDGSVYIANAVIYSIYLINTGWTHPRARRRSYSALQFQ